jgi:hypothetical protein
VLSVGQEAGECTRSVTVGSSLPPWFHPDIGSGRTCLVPEVFPDLAQSDQVFFKLFRYQFFILLIALGGATRFGEVG